MESKLPQLPSSICQWADLSLIWKLLLIHCLLKKECIKLGNEQDEKDKYAKKQCWGHFLCLEGDVMGLCWIWVGQHRRRGFLRNKWNEIMKHPSRWRRRKGFGHFGSEWNCPFGMQIDGVGGGGGWTEAKWRWNGIGKMNEWMNGFWERSNGHIGGLQNESERMMTPK